MKMHRSSSVIPTTVSPVIPTTVRRRDPRRSRKGFTLTEMLISVLLLGFVSVMVAVMTTAVLSSTTTMQEVAQAEILGNEALENVQSQLRIAQKIEVGKETGQVNFDIDDANTGYTFDVEEGVIVLVKSAGGEAKSEVLFGGVSYGNLRVSSLQFTGDVTRGCIEIFVGISFGEKVLWEGSVTVEPLNGMTVV